jgi:peptidoglycan hydrolase-like protein with peptidoglycan-binding domain
MQHRWAIAAALCLAVPAFAQGPSPLLYSHALSPAAIASVQEKLRQAGLFNGRADGTWTTQSQLALERFQQTRNLPITGQITEATASVLGLSTAELMTPAGPDAATIRSVQQRLATSGAFRGAADGQWNAATQAALARFQQGRGLPATGQLNPPTLQALGLEPAARPR